MEVVIFVLGVAGIFGPLPLLLAAFRWHGAWRVWAILPLLSWLGFLLLWHKPNAPQERWLFPTETLFIIGVGLYVLVLVLAIWHYRFIRR